MQRRYRFQRHTAFHSARPIGDFLLEAGICSSPARLNSGDETMYELPIRGRIAAVATAMLIAFSGLAAAGECPVGKVKEGAVTSGPMAPVGVTDTVIGSVD